MMENMKYKTGEALMRSAGSYAGCRTAEWKRPLNFWIFPIQCIKAAWLPRNDLTDAMKWSSRMYPSDIPVPTFGRCVMWIWSSKSENGLPLWVKTAIYISHRLSSCKFCDEIAVFHDGAVIQQGSHAELTADTNGKYYELWNAQAQYYIEWLAKVAFEKSSWIKLRKL